MIRFGARALLALIVLMTPAMGRAAAADAVAYELAPVSDAQGLTALAVTIRFHGDASGRTKLVLPQRGQNNPRLWQYVRDLTIDGATSVAADQPEARIITAPPGAALVVRYRVVSAFDEDPSTKNKDKQKPTIRPGWFWAYGEALFAEPQGRDRAPARFTWTGGREVTFVSTLQDLGPGAKVDDVLASTSAGGRDLRIFTHGGAKDRLRIAVVRPFDFTAEAADARISAVIQATQAFWRPKPQPFLVILQPLTPSPASLAEAGEGRSGGFSIVASRNRGLDDLTHTIAHEYFHTWNPGQLGGSRLSEDQALDYWFGEGFTDFYADRMLVRSGVQGPDAFVAQWNDRLAAYANSPVRTEPNSRVGKDFWKRDGVAKLPYQRGAMLAAIWDADLRRSGSPVRLDQVMIAMRDAVAARPAGAGPTAPELFQATFERMTGRSLAADIAKYVTAGEPILLPADTFGPCARVVTEQVPAFDRGYDVAATSEAQMFAGVDPQGPAYAAGVRDGMKRLEVLGGKVGDHSVEVAYRVADANGERVIRYLPQGRRIVTQQRLTDVDPACRSGY